MNDCFRRAELQEVNAVVSLIKRRIQWMDEVGINQWNKCDYFMIFPMDYFRKQQSLGNLYVFSETGIKGAVVLLEDDPSWRDRTDSSALYIHNLVTDLNAPGVGKRIMACVEALAAKSGKRFLRLDCAADSTFLNSYYESLGFVPAGKCRIASYEGTKREKRIKL